MRNSRWCSNGFVSTGHTQVRSTGTFTLETILHERLSADSLSALEAAIKGGVELFTASKDIDTELLRLEEAFEMRFLQTYPEAIEYSELTRRSLSNLLGGLGFFYGTPEVGKPFIYAHLTISAAF